MGAASQEVGAPLRLVTFSSDYGPTDEYVGVCHLVIARIAPDVRVVDLAHGVRGVRAASTVLAQSVPHAPEGSVHLAVVDPGVGTERRGVAVGTGRGDLLVGPDNGLLLPAAAALDGAVAAFELTDPRYRLEPLSSTFHGRDIFAPAAAYLAVGVLAPELGAEIDPEELVRPPETSTESSAGVLVSDVARFDWYGNVQLAATASDLAEAGLDGEISVTCASGGFEARTGRKFADAPEGGLVVYVDSGGHVAVACNGGSARQLLQDPDRITLKRKS